MSFEEKRMTGQWVCRFCGGRMRVAPGYRLSSLCISHALHNDLECFKKVVRISAETGGDAWLQIPTNKAPS